jgi:hypothetical protein
MADEIARGQLDAKAARGHLVAGAIARRPARSRFRSLRWTAGAAFVRVGTLIHGSAKEIGTTRPVNSREAC